LKLGLTLVEREKRQKNATEKFCKILETNPFSKYFFDLSKVLSLWERI